jgi:hypothetical protein
MCYIMLVLSTNFFPLRNKYSKQMVFKTSCLKMFGKNLAQPGQELNNTAGSSCMKTQLGASTFDLHVIFQSFDGFNIYFALQAETWKQADPDKISQRQVLKAKRRIGAVSIVP